MSTKRIVRHGRRAIACGCLALMSSAAMAADDTRPAHIPDLSSGGISWDLDNFSISVSSLFAFNFAFITFFKGVLPITKSPLDYYIYIFNFKDDFYSVI